MNKLRFSSGMLVYAIISAAVIAAGLVLGLVMHFTSGAFFNWGGEYAGFRSIEVQYSAFDIKEEDVKKAAEDAFADNGVSYYAFVTAGESTECRIEYRFASSQDAEAVAKAAEAIDSAVGIDSNFTGHATAYTELAAERNASVDITYAAIAVSAAVVFQFIYFLIRFRLAMAAAAFVADVHNLALFYALLALTRVQVTPAVVAVSALCVLVTMIGCGMMFDRMRKLFRTDEYKAMSSFEQADGAARSAFPMVTLVNAVVFAALLLMLVFTAIAGGTVFGLFMPCLGAMLAVLASQYGTTLFTPAVYSRLKARADKRAAEKQIKYVGAKKSAEAAE